MPKEKASSPMMAAESLLMSWVIDAKENHDVMTLDVPSTFAQDDMPENINGERATLQICRVLVSMSCEIAPEVYEDFVTHDNNNNKIFYMLMSLSHFIEC